MADKTETAPTNGQTETSIGYLDYLEKPVVVDAPLDKKLLKMEEEFMDSFEKRMSRTMEIPDLTFVKDGDDLHKTISIFRKVAQEMGDEWKPVFLELMKNQKKETVDQELMQLEEHKPLIRGYRSLMVWKELSGSLFHITRLIDALRKNKMDDIAEQVLFMINDKTPLKQKFNLGGVKRSSSNRRKRIEIPENEQEPIDNKTLLNIAKKISNEWKQLGEKLKLEEEELNDINGYVGAQHEKSFKVLWSWKENHKKEEDLKSKLKQVLLEMGKKELVEETLENKK